MRSVVVLAALVGALSVFVPRNALAIEPDAPGKLISAGEGLALRVGVQLRREANKTGRKNSLDRLAMADFYGQHADGLVWTDGAGLTPRAKALLAEIRRADTWGLEAKDFELPADRDALHSAAWSEGERVAAEIKVGLALLKYARHARGGRVDPTMLSLDFDRKPKLLPGHEVLTAAASATDPALYLRDLHPQHEQFRRLRSIYAEALSNEFGSDALSQAGNDLVKQKSKRKRKSKGRRRLSRAAKLEKVRLNMEMWRWMPTELGERHIYANIPEYQVRVVKGGSVVHRERMVVGKTKHKTPIFSDEMETIVFQPYWIVPNSIKVKEMLPRLLRGSSLRGMKISTSVGGREIDPWSVNWNNRDIRSYVVYQPPGRRNALGKVKFLFPNRHAIYFHDTPSKHLFKRSRRAYSHGCMRVRNPLRLAQVLLASDRGWKMNQIRQITKQGPENNAVRLKRKIPVHVAYFTAAVQNGGSLKFFDDVYGHEKIVRRGLAGKINTLVKPQQEDLGKVRAQVVARAGGQKRGRSRSASRRKLSGGYRSGLGAVRPARRGVASRPRASVRRATSRRRVRRSRRSNWSRSVFSNGGG